MELREIRSFLILAEQLHFGRAARLLHVSQPALTKQMRRLEDELGGALLLRSRHGAQLTSLGRLFREGALKLVRDADELISHTRRVARGQGGRLRIGFGFHTFDLVPRLIVRLRKSLPEIDITLRDMSTSEQVEELLSEKLDLGFIRSTSIKGLETLPVHKDRVMIATSLAANYPATLDLASLRHTPFVLISRQRSPTFHRHVLEICAQHGFHPHVVQEVPEVTTVLALARAGLGIAMIPESFSRTHLQGIRFHKIPGSIATWTIAAAWRKGDPNPLLLRFLSLLKTEIKNQLPRPNLSAPKHKRG